ncbi:hypothetical protein H2200_001738 [Cladophialophora chaetospira]|uniref:Uncharacterized protein n=1 Tax=Cladophialophora chaetospira TaxID=386627 RepID=A0AA38XLG2_9EURO|nr:hypothetical protein H2200_001738 [Cladophialophora chaetospira]
MAPEPHPGLAILAVSSARKFQPLTLDYTSCRRIAPVQPLVDLHGHRHRSGSGFYQELDSSIMIQREHIAQLMAFHAAHFPGQPTPKPTTTQQLSVGETETGQPAVNSDDDLGHYEDGAKRTLTDTQIKLFRHSEIQRLLSERRAAAEKASKQKSSKGDDISSQGPREARKRRFYDEPSTDRSNVDLLSYDDPQENPSTSSPAKKFLWPILGKQPTP